MRRPVHGSASLRMIIAAAMLGAACAPTQAPAQQVAGKAMTDVPARLRHADDAFAAGERDRAEREYAAVLALDPAQSRAVFRLAQLREKRDLRGAITLYRRYVVLEPRDAWGHMALGTALAASGDVKGALAAYDAASRLAPRERDVYIGRARALARARHTDASIAAYEELVAQDSRDVEAWRELAGQQRVAGDHRSALSSLLRARSLTPAGAAQQAIDRDIRRNRVAMRASIAPVAGGSRDSDGLSTTRTGVTASTALVGRSRLSASAALRRAGDGTHARATQELGAAIQLRPMAQFRLELEGGIRRADRALIDAPTNAPVGGPRRPQAPIGRTTPAGAGTYESVPVGRARVVWRRPGDGVAIDARAGRQLLEASPFLVAQGVLRDEAAATVDLRVHGPVRVRGFARTAAIHNEDERNRRDVLGGALGWVPGSYELTLRGQRMTYRAPTALAYFAPRRVDGAEITAYLEREATGGATLALDLGAGAQQVTSWDAAGGTWSPALRGWAQFVVPLGAALSAGTEIEVYDSRIGMEGSSFVPTDSRWRYASVSGWLRVAF